MGMRIEKTVVVQAPAEAVWAFLTDPRRVASCLPGAAITDQIDPQTWGGTMAVKVGPVSANYRGKMKFERLDATAREADIAASGQETRGKGGADMRMSSRVIERGPAETKVVIVSDVNVVGVLAQFGRGMIEDVSDQMFGKFSAAMRRQLEAAPAATTTAAAPAPTPIPAGTASPTAGAEPALPPVSEPAQPEAPASSVAAPATLDAAPVGRAPRPPSGSASTAPSAGATAASPAPAATATPPRETEDVLDLGAIGTAAAGRAAGRVLRNPVFWIVVAILVAASWYLLR